MNLQRKILSAGLAAVMLAGVSMAEARQHGGVDAGAEVHQQVIAEANAEIANNAVAEAGMKPVHGEGQVTELAVNMNVDGLHPKYSNRVPESWHPMEEVDWQVKNQDSPQLLKRWPVTTEMPPSLPASSTSSSKPGSRWSHLKKVYGLMLYSSEPKKLS